MKSKTIQNYRVYAHTSQGGRKYQEDTLNLAYDYDSKKKSMEYIYFAVMDGHGGSNASVYAKDNLLKNIVSQENFWSDDDQLILDAIRTGFINTHNDMLKVVANWPKTSSGLPSTSGTTASVCFIRNGKYYTGHVGDSKIIIGKKNEKEKWTSYALTKDHKPDSPEERERIYKCGGEIINKCGVERVVWNRPKCGLEGPGRLTRSTSFERIPFLAVSRSLGDLWSYNPDSNMYVVSPEPDVDVIPINFEEDCCMILASDGLWNMMLDDEVIEALQNIEERQKDEIFSCFTSNISNPSSSLVNLCLQRWFSSRLRADNTSVITVLFDYESAPNMKLEDKLLNNCNSTSINNADTLNINREPVILSTSSLGCLYNIDPLEPSKLKSYPNWMTRFENELPNNAFQEMIHSFSLPPPNLTPENHYNKYNIHLRGLEKVSDSFDQNKNGQSRTNADTSRFYAKALKAINTENNEKNMNIYELNNDQDPTPAVFNNNDSTTSHSSTLSEDSLEYPSENSLQTEKKLKRSTKPLANIMQDHKKMWKRRLRKRRTHHDLSDIPLSRRLRSAHWADKFKSKRKYINKSWHSIMASTLVTKSKLRAQSSKSCL